MVSVRASSIDSVSDGTDDPAGGGLTDDDRAMLDFEADWRSSRRKDDRVRALFGLSMPRYYQAINALIDRPEALAYSPVLVQRLRRLRDARQAARSGAQLAPLH